MAPVANTREIILSLPLRVRLVECTKRNGRNAWVFSVPVSRYNLVLVGPTQSRKRENLNAKLHISLFKFRLVNIFDWVLQLDSERVASARWPSGPSGRLGCVI